MSQEKLDALKSEREQVVSQFEKTRQSIDEKVMQKLDEAGLGNVLRDARAELEQTRVQAQSRVDFLTGQISMLEEVLGVTAEGAASEEMAQA